MVELEVARYAVRTFARCGFTDQFWAFGPVVSRQSGNDWADGTCKAQCLKSAIDFSEREHDAPGEDCRCGIYGCLTLEHLIFQYPVEAKDIIAVIAAEGTTYMGSKGMRTQYARVVAYWTPIGAGVTEVAAHQFQDAKRFDDLFAMAESYGLGLHMEEPPCPGEHYTEYIKHFDTTRGWGFPPEFAELFGRRPRVSW